MCRVSEQFERDQQAAYGGSGQAGARSQIADRGALGPVLKGLDDGEPRAGERTKSGLPSWVSVFTWAIIARLGCGSRVGASAFRRVGERPGDFIT